MITKPCGAGPSFPQSRASQAACAAVDLGRFTAEGPQHESAPSPAACEALPFGWEDLVPQLRFGRKNRSVACYGSSDVNWQHHRLPFEALSCGKTCSSPWQGASLVIQSLYFTKLNILQKSGL